MDELSPEERFASLSPRQKEVLKLICQMHGYLDIADQLVIAKSTVKAHMHIIYQKLGLDMLDRDERVVIIHTTYCPMFDQQREDEGTPDMEILDLEPEPDPLSPEEETMLDNDEVALVAYHPTILHPKPVQQKPQKRTRRGCLFFSGVLTALACILVIAGAAGWWAMNNLDIPSLGEALPQVFTEVPDFPTTQPEKEDYPPAAAQEENVVEAPTLEGLVYEMGEWHKQGDVWIRVSDYEIKTRGAYFTIEIWNQDSHDLFFSWSPLQSMSLTDNIGNSYEFTKSTTSYGGSPREEIFEANSRDWLQLALYDWATSFDSDPIFQGGVTDLYLTVEYLANFDTATWHINIGQ